MPMFHMFLTSPPGATPVNTVYREKQAFGPYSSGGTSGFSVGVIMEVAEAASPEFRNLRTFCMGWLYVVGVQSGFDPADPLSPLVVSLIPNAPELRELATICRAAEIEVPVVFSYIGLDPLEFETNLSPVVDMAPDITGLALGPAERWQRFRDGEYGVFVGAGYNLGAISTQNLSAGFRQCGFAARTSPVGVLDPSADPSNFLDPVVLYNELTGSNLSDGTPAIPAAQVTNSWMDVATQDRVLITFRDEWNQPLVAAGETATVSGGAAPVAGSMTIDRGGTLAAPGGWPNYTCTIPGRKLTPVPSSEGAADNVVITVGPPAHRVVGTVRPEDWFHPTDPALSDSTKNLPLYTNGNLVEPLVDGFETYPRLVQEIRRVSGSSHFVLLAGWRTLHDFELIPGDATSTLENLLTDANSHGATIRSMIWDMPALFNSPAHWFIDGLSNGQSILDDRTHHSFNTAVVVGSTLAGTLAGLGVGGLFGALGGAGVGAGASIAVEAHHAGSHHWKYTVVRNSEGTAAYVGGIDINPNRLDGPDHRSRDTRYHDVHCRVEGPAVADFTKAFVDRWSDHPDHSGTLSVSPTTTSPSNGTAMVQVARTWGAGTQSYAPNGDRTIWASLRRAIGRARKYIYIEDQYLSYAGLSAELLGALSRIDYLVIVMDGLCDMGVPPGADDDCARARYLFLNPLNTAHPNKLKVFTLGNHGSDYKVHTKVVIVDDVFATIGSANMSRRSMTHDSEINAFVLDGRVEDGARKFARDLRIKLWAEHLGWHRRIPMAEARLGNIDRAVEYLTTRRPAGARLHPYNLSAGAGASYPLLWDNYVDPDGSSPP